MSNFTTAAESVDRLAVQFQGIMDLAALLKTVGSLDNAAAEYKAAADAALAETVKAQEELDAVEQKIAAAQAQVQDITDLATAKANDIVAAAQDRAQQIADDAATRADRALAEAQTAANASVAASNATLADLNNKISWAQGELKDLNEAHDKVSAGVATAEAQLEAIKAAIAKIVGG